MRIGCLTRYSIFLRWLGAVRYHVVLYYYRFYSLAVNLSICETKHYCFTSCIGNRKHDHILKCHHILLMEAYDYVSVNFSMKLPESFQAEMSF